jgi:hypothetical protein
MTETLQTLADRQAITDLIYRYCRAVDRIDAELGYTIYHEDGVADYLPGFEGSGRGSIDYVCKSHQLATGTSHQVSNIIIQLDGDRAASESYVTATLRIKYGDQLKHLTCWGRYVDRWSRRGGRWGIDKRQAVIDYNEVRDFTPLPGENAGRNDRTDPSYAVLKDVR